MSTMNKAKRTLSTQAVSLKRPRKSYTAAYKLRVVHFANETCITSAAKLFNLSHSLVSRWAKNVPKFEACKPQCRKIGSGRTPAHLQLETQLHSTLVKERQEGRPVSMVSLKSRMLALVANSPASPQLNPLLPFKASWSWASGFMRRFNWSLRAFTTKVKAANTSKECDIAAKVDNFKQHLLELQQKNGYSDEFIINMDETPVWFETPPTKTLHKRGDKQVPLISSVQDKHRVTVTLAVTKSGRMLPPSIIEKSSCKLAKSTPQDTLRDVMGIKVWKQKSNTMTADLMVSWIQNYLKPLFPEECKKLVILDSFSGHIAQRTKDEFHKNGFDIAVIPGGCTKYLQPLDLTVNRSFKSTLKHEWQPAQNSGKVSPQDKLLKLVSEVKKEAESISPLYQKWLRKIDEMMRKTERWHTIHSYECMHSCLHHAM
jgi:transposase-like protein